MTNRTPSAASVPNGSLWRAAAVSPVTAIVVVWLCAALISVRAPDMVTGSQQEHLPMAAFTVWVWAAISTAYVAMAGRPDTGATMLTLGTSAVWVAVAIAGIFGPVMITGTDPTRIPLTVIVAPVVAAFTTGFLAIQQARRG